MKRAIEETMDNIDKLEEVLLTETDNLEQLDLKYFNCVLNAFLKEDPSLIEKTNKLWKDAKTFEDMKDLMKRYIMDEIYNVYYSVKFSDQNYAENKEEYRDLLYKINDLGLMTTDSQDSPKDIKTQKAYLCGLTTENTAKYLCIELNKIDGMVAYYSNNSESKYNFEGLFVTYSDEGTPMTTMCSFNCEIDEIKSINKDLSDMIEKELVYFVAINAKLHDNTLLQTIVDLLSKKDD